MGSLRRRLPVGIFLLLSYLPFVVLTLATVTSTVVLIAKNEEKARQLKRNLARTSDEERIIDQLHEELSEARLASAGVLLVSLAAGVGILWGVHRSLRRRVERIAEYGRRIGKEDSLEPLEPLAPDILGALEQELGRLAEDVSEQKRLLRADAMRQQQDAQLQQALAAADTEQEAMLVAERALRKMVPEVTTELYLADSSEAHLRLQVSSRREGTACCPVRAPFECFAMRRGQTLAFADPDGIDACPRLYEREGRTPSVCVPVMVMGRSVGVVHATRLEDKPSERLVDTLESLSNHLGSRMAMIRALATSRLQADTDVLTGLVNRRGLFAQSATMLQDGKRASVAMADLDHFKRLNDVAGHAAGDRALRTFAEVVRRTLRPTDLVARHGGEEFAFVFPETSAIEASAILERVRSNLALALRRSDEAMFTVSFGVASFPQHGASLDELLHEADAALYRAKEAGRDRIILADAFERESRRPPPATRDEQAQG